VHKPRQVEVVLSRRLKILRCNSGGRLTRDGFVVACADFVNVPARNSTTKLNIPRAGPEVEVGSSNAGLVETRSVISIDELASFFWRRRKRKQSKAETQLRLARPEYEAYND
jgi:hypothetical protein